MDDLKSRNILYIILNYNFNENIYEILDNLLMFSFSFCSLSHKNISKFFFQCSNNYSLIFPTKQEEINLILNLKFEEIRFIINKRIEEYFKNYEEIQMYKNEIHSEYSFDKNESKLQNQFSAKNNGDSLHNHIENKQIKNESNDSTMKNTLNPINQIFKKILLENNAMMLHSNLKVSKNLETHSNHNHSSLLNTPLSYQEKIPNLGRSRVLIFSDMTNDSEFEYDQKLLFLMKRQNIYIDCLSIGTNEIINKLQSIAFYSDGLYDYVSNIDGLAQTLLQFFLSMPDERKHVKSFYSLQGIPPSKLLYCAECNFPHEQYFLITDTREIVCSRCIREKLKK